MDLYPKIKRGNERAQTQRMPSPRMGSPIEGLDHGLDAKRQLAEAQATWVEERKLLVDLLEKNQKLTASTQAALMNEKQEIEEHHRKLEESMRNRIEHLKSENNLLRE